MSDDTGGVLACSEILLRGVQWKYLEWDQEARKVAVRSDAFLRPRRLDGTVDPDLSVDRLALSTVAESFERWSVAFSKGNWTGMPMARSLHTGRLRDLAAGLEVIATPDGSNPAHAGIYGLPEPPEQRSETQMTAAGTMATTLLLMPCFAAYGTDDVEERVRLRDEHARGGLHPPKPARG